MIDGLENPRCGSQRKELIAPCLGCEKRNPGCHDKCEMYLGFKERIAKKNKYLNNSQWDVYDRQRPFKKSR